MNKSFLLASFLCVILLSCESSSNQSSDSSVKMMRAIYFTDLNNGFVVGDSGTIRKTTNGGVSWTINNSPVTSNLYAVSFADSNIGWCTGSDGAVIKTTNGGDNWFAQSTGTDEDIFSILITDASSIKVVGEGSLILNSTNGGSSWTTQWPSAVVNIKKITKIGSPSVEFIVGNNGRIISTEDNGSTWSIQQITTTGLNDIQFTSLTVGFVCGGGFIAKTTNSGDNWTGLNSQGKRLRSIFFRNSSNGFIAAADGNLINTTDSGLSWNVLETGLVGDLQAITFSNTTTGFVIGPFDNFAKSTNSGITWTIASY